MVDLKKYSNLIIGKTFGIMDNGGLKQAWETEQITTRYYVHKNTTPEEKQFYWENISTFLRQNNVKL